MELGRLFSLMPQNNEIKHHLKNLIKLSVYTKYFFLASPDILTSSQDIQLILTGALRQTFFIFARLAHWPACPANSLEGPKNYYSLT